MRFGIKLFGCIIVSFIALLYLATAMSTTRTSAFTVVHKVEVKEPVVNSVDTVKVFSTCEPEVEIETLEEPVVEPVAEEVVTPVFNYTEEDLDLLARLIFSEGGIESYETQLKIGSVVMNRVCSPRFPNTIREVIYQQNQFSVTFVDINGNAPIDQPADEEAKNAALEILTYGSVLPEDVQVFFHKSITTGWVATREPYGTFDRTTFAYIYSRS